MNVRKLGFREPTQENLSVFRRAVVIMREVHNDIAYGWSPKLARHNNTEEDILAKAQQGTKFMCGTFSRLFFLRCTAAGIPAREILAIRAGVERIDVDDPWSVFTRHRVVEVNTAQLHERAVWLLLDPTNALYYTDNNGQPLNALQTHMTWMQQRKQEIPHVSINGPFQRPQEPAYELRGGQWTKFADAAKVDEIFRFLIQKKYLLYYHHLVYPPRKGGEPATQWVDTDTPELQEHRNTPLEQTTGPVRVCKNALELYPSVI